MPVLAVNKKAGFDYDLMDSFEAGLILTGPEVKSIKAGHVSLKGAFVTRHDRKGRIEFWLTNALVSAYKYADNSEYEPSRSRQILLKKSEIIRLVGKTQEKGLTLVPTKIYTKGSLIKLEFAIARGKKKHDKREMIKKRDVERDLRRTAKG